MDPRTFIEGFPESLWRVIERSLARDRDARYASAGDMAIDLDMFLGTARLADLRAKLVRFIEELFPAEAEKQADWLSEATGHDRKTFAPSVPLAEVPAAEQSMPAVVSELEPEPETETESESESEAGSEAAAPEPEPEPAAVKSTRDIVVYSLVGAMMGLVVVVLWIAFVR